MDINIKEICFPCTISLLEAMKALDSNALQIILVVDEKKKLVGTLTDGDIRRGLLKGFSLKSPINAFMNRDFKSIKSSDDKEETILMMKKDRIRRIPIVDDQQNVLDLLLIEDFVNVKDINNTVVILAGGKGKRLRPFTNNCPKPMLKVEGKPILEIILENCISCGVTDFVFSVNYLKDKIIDYFGDGSKWNVKINYLIEDKPLGTAGSLSLISQDSIEPLVVINGDILTRIDLRKFIEFHNDLKAEATMAVREEKLQLHYGVIQNDGFNLVDIQEKPLITHQVNTGVYILNPSLLKLISPNEYLDMTTLLMNANENDKKVCIYPIHEYWIDVGRPENLRQANEDLTKDKKE